MSPVTFPFLASSYVQLMLKSLRVCCKGALVSPLTFFIIQKKSFIKNIAAISIIIHNIAVSNSILFNQLIL